MLSKNREKGRENEKTYYQNNREVVLNRRKEYYKNNKERINKVKKIYYEKNKEDSLKGMKIWYKKNRKLKLEKSKEWYKNNINHAIDLRRKHYECNKEQYCLNNKLWKKNNKEKYIMIMRKYFKDRRSNDLEFRLLMNLRRILLLNFYKYSTNGKLGKSKNYYGIDWNSIIQKLILTLPEDYYENGGSKYYHVDHMIPCSMFNFDRPEEVRVCFSSGNVQWMLAKENLKKGNKMVFNDNGVWCNGD